MIGVEELTPPSAADLWAIESESELLAAEFAVVDAESAWYSDPCPDSAADYLEALVEVVDLLDFYGCLSGLVAA